MEDDFLDGNVYDDGTTRSNLPIPDIFKENLVVMKLERQISSLSMEGIERYNEHL